ncbi:MAG: tyrosine-type recombinase/integrase [Clostridiales bacterium]|nr:tyrosine-type recombinase/integrase [Clostridiales bacterium]
MELSIVKKDGKELVLLLDDELRPVKAANDFLEYQRLRERAPNTIKANGRDLKIYWDFLNKSGLAYDKVTPMAILRFIDFLRNGVMSGNIISLFAESARTPKTINRILSTVHQFYKFCNMTHEIDNPIIMDDIPRSPNMFKSLLHHAKRDNKTKQSIFKVKESRRKVRLITDEEAEVFLNSLPTKRDRLLFKTLYLTGARIQEALDLEIESIPYPDNSQAIGILQSIKSKGKRRNLYMPMSLIAELDAFILEERSLVETTHSFIFVSQQRRHLGKPLTYRGIYEVFNAVKRKTGIHFNFHDLRHTLISNLAESGMDMSILMIIAGHEHISTTQEYTHLSAPYIRDRLAKYWANSILSGGDADVE